MTRRSLLASLMALSLLCGGLGVATATDVVHVNESATGTAEVYTKAGVDTLLEGKADKTALENKANATDVATNKANIDKNKENITKLENDKLRIDVASATYATKDALDGLTTVVNGKADAADVNNKLANKADAAALDGKANKADVYSKTDADTTFATKTELNAKADTTALGEYAKTVDVNNALNAKANKTDLDTANGKITDLQAKTANLSADGKELTGMTTVSGAKVSGDNVEAGALKVIGEISNGAGVTTTLADIKDSMDQTGTNKTWIGRLKDKTTKITYDASNGTSVDGVTFNAGAVTGVTSINGTKIGTQEGGTYIHQDNSIWGNMKNVDTQVTTNADNIKKNKDDITALDTKVGTVNTGTYLDPIKSVGDNLGLLDAGLKKEVGDRTAAVEAEKTAREAEDTNLSNRIGTVTEDGKYIKKSTTNNVSENLKVLDTQAKTNADAIAQETADRKAAIGELAVNGNYIEKDKNVSDNLVKLDNQAKANANEIVKTNERTGGIKRNTEKTQTTIEDSVKVDNQGNVKDVKGLSAETITTTGDATIGGDLKVAGTITTDKMVFGDPATNNYTEIDHGKVTSKNLVVNGAGETISSSSTFNAKENKVGFANSATGEQSSHKQTSDMIVDNVKNNITGDQSFHKQTSDVIMDNVKDLHNSNNRTQTKTETKDIITDKDGNSSTTSQTASENKTYLKDKDGKNTNSTIDTAKGYDKTIKGENGETSTKQDELNITNTAQNGTITNDAQNIVNNASGNITNKANTMDTNVTGKATESYGSLDTTVNGNETHIVKGTKTETVDGKVTENYKDGQATNVTGNQDIHVTGKQTNTVEGGQENIISGGQINNITGDQTTTITGNKNETVTENVTEDYKKDLTTTVGGNEIHEVKGIKTETVEGKLTENFKGGQETNVTGDQTTNVSGTQTTTATDINRNASSGMIDTIDNDYGTNTETKVAGKTTTDVSIKGTGEKGQYIRGANESRDYLIKGTLKNSETKTAEATSTEITDGNGKTSSTIQDVTQISGSVTDGTNTSVSNVKANSIDSAVTDGSSISTINQKKNSITSQVTDGTTITKTEQDTKNITNTAKDGTITNDAKDIVNNASGNMTNTVGGDLTTTVSGNELHEVAGKQTNKIDGDQENTIGGNQTTTVTGDISNKAENITNEANTKLTDKVGENTRVLDSEGITDTVGGSTFKQRIDKIMMESKDVSIKAKETLTNEAKVITNKASEVINNEAVNINNTATGIITSKASEIKNQADKLISNKVGENTWENMENGKITTSIKDGAKQNLTQSDAAGTTQSTVDGGKSTVTIQNADGLADAVTDGTNTSVQNQTASAIAAAVKDGAGNENASVANATTSANTIKSGSKVNTVISTADGTSFINSEAAAPVGDGTEVKTTIKGNTITTGKVTMDYAEVMKDLGVRGNANITGKTTTGSLEVTGTSTLKGNVTMESNATVKKDLTVEGNTNLKNTKVDGTLDVTKKATFGDSVSIAKDLSVDGNATIKGDVTAKSYKVGDKTYISAAGINANDQKITNVADGSISEGSKDAVNGGQLYTVKNDLEGKVNKVGANAAAMANLHPMEFDPDSKWNIAAAIGNYGSESAAALGAFYRPNDDVMVNLSTTFGTGENMVGGGVSVRLGKGGNKLSREETNALKAQVADLTARMDALLSVLNPNMSKDFPDVPENHWAYEAVSRLAGNDIVQGYPDGEFHGERTMTRYEMAEIIYNALSRGAEAEKELVEEFKPELQAMAASEKATAEKAEG